MGKLTHKILKWNLNLVFLGYTSKYAHKEMYSRVLNPKLRDIGELAGLVDQAV